MAYISHSIEQLKEVKELLVGAGDGILGIISRLGEADARADGLDTRNLAEARHAISLIIGWIIIEQQRLARVKLRPIDHRYLTQVHDRRPQAKPAMKRSSSAGCRRDPLDATREWGDERQDSFRKEIQRRIAAAAAVAAAAARREKAKKARERRLAYQLLGDGDSKNNVFRECTAAAVKAREKENWKAYDPANRANGGGRSKKRRNRSRSKKRSRRRYRR